MGSIMRVSIMDF